MALDKLTIIDGGGLSTTSDYRVGIITATKFVGPVEGAITSTDATFTGNVSIAGTLTYEDVTNIDSVGLITARDGIFLPDTKKAQFGNTAADPDLEIYHGGTASYISHSGTGNLFIHSNTVAIRKQNQQAYFVGVNGQSKLYEGGSERLVTTDKGITVGTGVTIETNGQATYTGIVTATTFSGSGASLTGISNANISNSAAIAGSKINPNFGSQDIETTGSATIQRLFIEAGVPSIYFTDTSDNPDYHIAINSGNFNIQDTTNSANRFRINASGKVSIANDLNVGTGVTIESNGNSNFVGVSSLGTGDTGAVYLYNPDADALSGTTNDIYGWKAKTYTSGLQVNSTLYLSRSGVHGLALSYNNATGGYINQSVGFLNISCPGGLPIYLNAYQHVLQDPGGKKRIVINDSSDQAIQLYHDGDVKLTTQTSGVMITGALRLQGTESAYLTGQAQPLIYRTGSTSGSYPFNAFGHLVIQTRADGSNRDIIFATGTSSANQIVINSDGDMKLPDGKELQFGGPLDSGDGDLRIHHNGTHSYITNTTGQLAIENTASNISIKASSSTGDIIMRAGGDTSSENAIVAVHHGEVVLSFNGVTKLSTTATGITVTGEVATSQDYPNFRPTLDFNFAAVKKLDPRITYYRTGPASFVNEFGKVVKVSDNAPRFDHDPITRECKGLLIEASRTNVAEVSEDFDNTTHWEKYSVTVTTNVVTAPDGTLTADNIIPAAGSSAARYLYFSNNEFPLSTNTTYTTSIFVKKNGLRYFAFQAHDNGSGSGHRAGFDLDNGTVVSGTPNNMGSASGVSASIVEFPNGWFRCILTGTTAGSGSIGRTAFCFSSALDANAGVGAITADGTNGGYVWGHQVEAGAFATSYIPTDLYTATRGNEHAVIDGEDFTDFYNPVESSVLAVGTMQRPAASQGQLNILHIGDSNEDGHGIFRENGTKDVWYHIRNNNTTPSGGNLNPSSFGDWDAGEEARIAIAFKDGDQAISVNGGNQVTATVTSSYPTADITKMWIGSHGNGSYFEGHIQRIAYYPKQLTDNQLNTLTA